MIVDCITYYNERELLDLRLKLLAPYVDLFVIVQGNYTHSGQLIPPYCDLDITDFPNQYHAQLRLVCCNLAAERTDWGREGKQRNSILLGLGEIPSDAMIMFSDADEIPNPNIVGQHGVYQQKMCYFYMNVQADYPWHGTICVPKCVFTGGIKPNELRQAMHAGSFSGLPVVENAGWHFSSLGGTDRVHQKLRAYAHQEYNTDEHHSALEDRMANLQDSFGRGEQYRTVPIDDSYPEEIRHNIQSYAQFLYAV